MNGTVNRIRGNGAFCFLKLPDGTSLFAHRNSFEEPGAMNPGQKVSFEVISTPKGLEANNLKKSQ